MWAALLGWHVRRPHSDDLYALCNPPVLSALTCPCPGHCLACPRACYKLTAGGRLGGSHSLDGLDCLLVCGARRLGPQRSLRQHP